MKRSGRWFAAVAAAVVAVTLAGCRAANASGGTPQPAGSPSAAASPGPSGPAALAGGACLLMDYATIREDLGVQFSVAAAADTSGSYTCLLRTATTNLPDLVLSITATDLTSAEFLANVQPSGATKVTELGKVGYVQQVAGSSGTGPAVEVGWLSGNDRLITLRYTSGQGTAAADIAAMATNMVTLARHVDATTV
ncbi:MAG TPA: hypothetical protein VKB69_16490 [Micromonosporaceae bacterium]|nr:hypothetical protein [Micromonosporaceae bacterium]